MIYQPIGVIIGVLGLIISIIRFKSGKSSAGMLGFWILVWAITIVISIYPDSTTFFANLFGIGRGLDFILIIAILGCYYLIFKIYNMIEQVESEITELVRQIALNNENENNKNDSQEDDASNKLES
ncbi:MAG: DUF2304 family protein [Methanobacteriaceae archaeon]|nr:DUF2304 family protein [Methanobacteriaceae archaeon]MDZ4171552.1 DUF2304 family protein [Methanobacteriaceae archaeon]